jgi:hypothetical protein
MYGVGSLSGKVFPLKNFIGKGNGFFPGNPDYSDGCNT